MPVPALASGDRHRWGIPWPAAIAALVVGCLFFVPAPSWYRLVSFISAAALVTSIMGGAGLPVLRRAARPIPGPREAGQAGRRSGRDA